MTSKAIIEQDSGVEAGEELPDEESIARVDLTAGPEHHDFTVMPEDIGQRLDRVLAHHLSDFSRSRLAQLVDEGRVTVDGVVGRVSARLKAGQVVAVEVPAPVPTAPQPEAIPLSILYEDASLLVVDKPAGMVVHPAAGVWSGTLVNALLHHVRDLAGIGGELRPGIVHRLDKETSGAIVVAKTEAALRGLQQAFQAHEVHKQYWALVHGTPPEAGTYDTPFGRHPIERVRMTGRLPPTDPRAKRAITHFRTAEVLAGGEAAQVEVTLQTGRTHQIRVHLSEAGYPLLGDATYGGTKRDRRAPPAVRAAAELIGRQALHAHVLAFRHPITGAEVRCEAPLPPALVRAVALLRQAGA